MIEWIITSASKSSLADWVTAVSTFVIATGIVITLWSVIIDHQRSRKQRAIDIMLAWNSGRDLISDYIIRSLNHEQLLKLFNKEPFEADESLKPALELFFLKVGLIHLPIREDFIPVNNNKIRLDSFQANILNIYATKSINFLEIVACAWKNDVVYEPIILEEFEKVFLDPTNRNSRYDGYIKASGVYHSILEIIKRYSEHEEKKYKKRKKWYHLF